jgi:hemoglobin-like flavoprotein
MTVDQATMEVAKASFARCSGSDAFFEAFYRNFFAVCPEAEPMFARTDFARQIKLLRHAIGLMLIFGAQPEAEPTVLSRVAERHSRRDLAVRAELYEPFVASLIETVAQYDPEFTDDVDDAWRRTIAPAVAYMQSKF